MSTSTTNMQLKKSIFYLLLTSGRAEFRLNLGLLLGDLHANLFLGDLLLFSLSGISSATSPSTLGWALDRELKNLGLFVGPDGAGCSSSSSSDSSSVSLEFCLFV